MVTLSPCHLVTLSPGHLVNTYMSLLFLFVDGIGLAPAGPDNPLASADTPALHSLLGGPLTAEAVQEREGLLLRPIDANLGVEGLPQSGTGHTALLGGFNAAALHGRHQPHFPPVALRPRLAQENIFTMAHGQGRRAAFANLFGPNYWVALAAGKLRRSASVIAAEGAGVRLRTIEDFQAGRAVCWDVTGILLQHREPEITPVAPLTAGAALAGLAHDHELVFFETFLPDLAGHDRLAITLPEALTLVDALIGATLAAMRPTDTLLVTSDHGNAESIVLRTHTRNPVPLLAVGPQALTFASVEDIAGIAGAIVHGLSK
jgi:2,3-bisphosphoglycerate-independent phosphoglycerate mutase